MSTTEASPPPVHLNLLPTPDNLRAEIARYHLKNSTVSQESGVDETVIAAYKTGRRPLYSNQARRIAAAVNRLVGVAVFRLPVDERGILLDQVPAVE